MHEKLGGLRGAQRDGIEVDLAGARGAPQHRGDQGWKRSPILRRQVAAQPVVLVEQLAAGEP